LFACILAAPLKWIFVSKGAAGQPQASLARTAAPAGPQKFYGGYGGKCYDEFRKFADQGVYRYVICAAGEAHAHDIDSWQRLLQSKR
jgi:hypothetical protein